MPNKPKNVTLTNASVDVLNAIRNAADIDYQNYVPVATPDSECIRKIGATIMDNPTLLNTFLNSLINRIGRVLVTSKLYANPLAPLKKGILEYGETVEEIFVNIAKPQTYDPETSEDEIWKREIPDVKAAFHIMNFKKFYKATIEEQEIKQAFLSIQGVTDLISRIVESMYTGANYDEFQVMKYMIAQMILNGKMHSVKVDTSNVHDIVTKFKSMSNKFEFMSSDYNLAKVKTHSMRNDQYLLINSEVDASIDVNVLASAFNMQKAEFMGHRILIDSFGCIDTERLAILFEGDPNYEEISAEDLKMLDEIPAILIDRDYLMCFDNLLTTRTANNGQGLYNQYWLHKWSTFSTSPFANAVVFVADTPTVTDVNVTPSSLTLTKVGQTAQLKANVTTTNFAPQSVNWASDSDSVTVDNRGIVTLVNGDSSTVNITATSTFDNSKSAKAILTITV